MHIYRSEDLHNRHVNNEASQAFEQKSIGEEAYKRILATYTTSLYTPNYFIRIALAILTLVAISFSGLLITLVFNSSPLVLLVLLAAIDYAVLELMVKDKLYYNAGIDNLLLFFSAAFFVGAFAADKYAGQDIVVSGIAMIVCLYLAIRFVDGFMAVLSYLALLVFVFLVYTKMGGFAKATAPFMMMMISASVYASMRTLMKNEKLVLYRKCFNDVLLTSLFSFYACGNYYVIKELSNNLFNLHLSLNDPIPFGWLFWILTFVIPIAYVGYGIVKKSLMFIRTGLTLVGASVLTFRYYYHVVPVEIAMLVGGFLLSTISYAVMKYLRTPKHGFSLDKSIERDKESSVLEPFIIAEISGKEAGSDAEVEFGGGSFGSGGAGSNY